LEANQLPKRLPLVARESRKAARAPERPATGNGPRGNGSVRLGVLADFIAFHLLLAQTASFRAFARHAGQRDLKPGRFGAMMVIHNNPGITQAALGRAISRDKSTVTPLVQELHRRGFIRRRPSAVDRRSITLTLTRAGEAALSDLLAHARAHDRRLDAIAGRRKPVLLALLRKIADALG
jgi:DNA-binding MarR family transcriptional regulator